MSALHTQSAVSHALFIVRRNVNSQPALSPASSCQDSKHSTEKDKPHHLYQLLEDAAKKTPLASCPQLVPFLYFIQTCRSFTTEAFFPLPMLPSTWVSSELVLTPIPTTPSKHKGCIPKHPHFPCGFQGLRMHRLSCFSCSEPGAAPGVISGSACVWQHRKSQALAAIGHTVSISKQSTSQETRKKQHKEQGAPSTPLLLTAILSPENINA